MIKCLKQCQNKVSALWCSIPYQYVFKWELSALFLADCLEKQEEESQDSSAHAQDSKHTGIKCEVILGEANIMITTKTAAFYLGEVKFF